MKNLGLYLAQLFHMVALCGTQGTHSDLPYDVKSHLPVSQCPSVALVHLQVADEP
jgi:hypothetical protein